MNVWVWVLFTAAKWLGDVVLVHGTGVVSAFAFQFASRAGARAIATSSSNKKLARTGDFGAAALINYRNVTDWEARAGEMGRNERVDFVVEADGPTEAGSGTRRWSRGRACAHQPASKG